jgi:hypothetical protein
MPCNKPNWIILMRRGTDKEGENTLYPEATDRLRPHDAP